MDPPLESIIQTLRFEYAMGDVTQLTFPHSTGWRTLPWLVVSQARGYSGIVSYADGRVTRYGSGDGVCILPGVQHRIDMEMQAPASASWCHVNFFVLGSVNLFSLVEIDDIVHGETAERIGELCAELHRLHSTGDGIAHLVRRQSVGYDLCATIASLARETRQRERLIDEAQKLGPALQYMEAHIGDSITRDALASTVALSSSRFYAVFKKAFGIGPWDYLRDLRMRKAEQMLITTDEAIGQIGAQCGYPDPFHFSRQFRRTHGVSPLAYRVRVRESLGQSSGPTGITQPT